MLRPSIFSEASRNLVTGTTKGFWFGLALGIALAGLAATDASAIVRANGELVRWQGSGASIYIFYAEDSISGRSCDRLSLDANVRAAGAIRSIDGGLPIAALPSAPPPLWEITPGYAQLITTSAQPRGSNPAGTDGGLLLSEDLAAVLGRSAGDTLSTFVGEARVSGVFAVPDDGRDIALAYSVLTEVPNSGVFDACWVDVWPPSAVIVNSLPATLDATTDAEQPTFLNQYNETLGDTLGAKALYDERPTRFAALGGAIVGMCLGFLNVRLRRLELASALHAGVPRRALVAQLSIESTAWSLSASILCFPVVAWMSIANNPLGPNAALFAGGLVLLAGSVGVAVGTLGALSLTREHHLFAYFKERS